jgi:hypothetical protein
MVCETHRAIADADTQSDLVILAPPWHFYVVEVSAEHARNRGLPSLLIYNLYNNRVSVKRLF